ncbi:hypothetical protein BB561_005173 [Smittium simulii]|uniref:Spt20-like SEP domain-containing protein n=1 Tax=Smittium simulii TaxID=133385 RepID=A0A2T9YBL2_9FUNG|nr:hypothetical protein BB561_005173 [Smittium simulii]
MFEGNSPLNPNNFTDSLSDISFEDAFLDENLSSDALIPTNEDKDLTKLIHESSDKNSMITYKELLEPEHFTQSLETSKVNRKYEDMENLSTKKTPIEISSSLLSNDPFKNQKSKELQISEQSLGESQPDLDLEQNTEINKQSEYNSDSTDDFEDVEFELDQISDNEQGSDIENESKKSPLPIDSKAVELQVTPKGDAQISNFNIDFQNNKTEISKNISNNTHLELSKINDSNFSDSLRNDQTLPKDSINSSSTETNTFLKRKHLDILKKDKVFNRKKAQILNYLRDIYFLKKYKNHCPSLTVNLFDSHFKFDKQEGVFLYNESTKFFFDALNEGKIPIELLTILNDTRCQFYEGCIIVDINDSRNPSKNEDTEFFENFYNNEANFDNSTSSSDLNFLKKQKESKNLQNSDFKRSISTLNYLSGLKSKKDYESNQTPKQQIYDTPEAPPKDTSKSITYRKIMHPTPETMHLELLILQQNLKLSSTDLAETESKLLLCINPDLDLNSNSDCIFRDNAINYINCEHLIPRKRAKYNQAEIDLEKYQQKENQKLFVSANEETRQEFQPSFNRLNFVSEYSFNKKNNENKSLDETLKDLTKVDNAVADYRQAEQPPPQISTKKASKKSKKLASAQQQAALVKETKPTRIIRFIQNIGEKTTYFAFLFYRPSLSSEQCKCIFRIGTHYDTSIDGEIREFFIPSDSLIDTFINSIKKWYSLENIQTTFDSLSDSKKRGSASFESSTKPLIENFNPSNRLESEDINGNTNLILDTIDSKHSEISINESKSGYAETTTASAISLESESLKNILSSHQMTGNASDGSDDIANNSDLESSEMSAKDGLNKKSKNTKRKLSSNLKASAKASKLNKTSKALAKELALKQKKAEEAEKLKELEELKITKNTKKLKETKKVKELKTGKKTKELKDTKGTSIIPNQDDAEYKAASKKKDSDLVDTDSLLVVVNSNLKPLSVNKNSDTILKSPKQRGKKVIANKALGNKSTFKTTKFSSDINTEAELPAHSADSININTNLKNNAINDKTQNILNNNTQTEINSKLLDGVIANATSTDPTSSNSHLNTNLNVSNALESANLNPSIPSSQLQLINELQARGVLSSQSQPDNNTQMSPNSTYPNLNQAFMHKQSQQPSTLQEQQLAAHYLRQQAINSQLQLQGVKLPQGITKEMLANPKIKAIIQNKIIQHRQKQLELAQKQATFIADQSKQQENTPNLHTGLGSDLTNQMSLGAGLPQNNSAINSIHANNSNASTSQENFKIENTNQIQSQNNSQPNLQQAAFLQAQSSQQHQASIANANNLRASAVPESILNIPNLDQLNTAAVIQIFAKLHRIQLSTLPDEKKRNLIILAQRGALQAAIRKKQLMIQTQIAEARNQQLQKNATELSSDLKVSPSQQSSENISNNLFRGNNNANQYSAMAQNMVFNSQKSPLQSLVSPSTSMYNGAQSINNSLSPNFRSGKVLPKGNVANNNTTPDNQNLRLAVSELDPSAQKSADKPQFANSDVNDSNFNAVKTPNNNKAIDSSEQNNLLKNLNSPALSSKSGLSISSYKTKQNQSNIATNQLNDKLYEETNALSDKKPAIDHLIANSTPTFSNLMPTSSKTPNPLLSPDIIKQQNLFKLAQLAMNNPLNRIYQSSNS